MEEIKKISSSLIVDPATPMRVDLDRDKLWELADSIKAQGLINPITVRPVGDKFEVVAGHRRFKACQIAGVVDISCVVRDLTDDEVFNIMAAENIERQDVDPVEEAVFISRLLNKEGATIADVARRLNRSAAWVSDRLDILDFPEYMLVALATGELKLGVAKYLGPIADDVYRKQFVESAIKNGMSVMQAKLLHTQWEMGILAPSGDFMPTNDELPDTEKYRARAVCARCGVEAVEPNLKAVFIHYDCPSDDHDDA